MGAAVRSQAEIALLLFAPIIITFIIFIKPVILILYSDKFLPIEGMLYWAMGATLIKTMAWSISYTILAKASAKAFFLNEVIAILYTFGFNMVGYSFWGLTGFGISMVATYVVYLIQMLLMSRHYFCFSFGQKLWWLFVLLNLMVVSALLIKYLLPSIAVYVCGSLLLLISTGFSFRMLDKSIGIKQYIANKIHK